MGFMVGGPPRRGGGGGARENTIPISSETQNYNVKTIMMEKPPPI